jgi:hypothetical protein
MTPAEMADLLDGPPLLMPEGWRFWPVSGAAHLLLADRFLANMPAYPQGQFAGRGAVICGGGSYEASVYVACRMLRHVGWQHPIQVWHRGDAEPVSDRVRRLPDVTVVDVERHPARSSRRFVSGWAVKMFAVINCPFEEVFFLDADCYPIYNPDECFQPQHNPHGIVVWPDNPVVDQAIHWPSYGLLPDNEFGINGGHYVLEKKRAWRTLQLAAHYDDHCDYYYCYTSSPVPVGVFSDQEHFRIALRKLATPFQKYAERPLACICDSYIQAGPNGRTLFVHRWGSKFAPPDHFSRPPQWWLGQLPMELTTWQYFLEWLASSPTHYNDRLEEVPGWFSPAECRFWSESCTGRKVLELGRFQGRATIAAARTAKMVVSIDCGDEREAGIWLERHGVRHKVWLRAGEFSALVPTCGGSFDACLINSAHDGPCIQEMVKLVMPHLTHDAILGFYGYSDPTRPTVNQFVDSAAQQFGWRLTGTADSLAVFTIGGPDCATNVPTNAPVMSSDGRQLSGPALCNANID